MPPHSGHPFVDYYQSTPSGSVHHQQQGSSSTADYNSRALGYHNRHSEGEGRELVHQEGDHLQDSGGYVPDSAESGSTDADTYDTMQVW